MKLLSILYWVFIAVMIILTFASIPTRIYTDIAHSNPQKVVLDTIVYSVVTMFFGFLIGYEGYKYWQDKYLNAEEKIYTCITNVLDKLDKIRKNQPELTDTITKIEETMLKCYK